MREWSLCLKPTYAEWVSIDILLGGALRGCVSVDDPTWSPGLIEGPHASVLIFASTATRFSNMNFYLHVRSCSMFIECEIRLLRLEELCASRRLLKRADDRQEHPGLEAH